MYDTFSNSTLTISADSGKNDQHGLYRDQMYSKLWNYEKLYDRTGQDQHVSWAWKAPHPKHHERGWNAFGCEPLPIATRAWTLQERLASNRVLHYTDQEMAWECNGGTQCECGREATLRTYTFRGGEFQYLLNEQPEVVYQVWNNIVSHYSDRSITERTDRLPALSGLAKEFRKCMYEAIGKAPIYLAGLWKEALAAGLVWRTRKLTKRLEKTKLGPSWSWVSLECPVFYFKYEFGDHSGDQPLSLNMFPFRSEIDVLGAKVTLSTTDSTGQVAGGEIVLAGRAVELTFDPRAGPMKETERSEPDTLLYTVGDANDNSDMRHQYDSMPGHTREGDDVHPISKLFPRPDEACVNLYDDTNHLVKFWPDELDAEVELGKEHDSLLCMLVGEEQWLPRPGIEQNKLGENEGTRYMFYLMLKPSHVHGRYERAGLLMLPSEDKIPAFNDAQKTDVAII